MIRLTKYLVLTIIGVSALLAQNIPNTYHMGKSAFAKTNDSTPASNTIEDIQIAGDMVLLATGRGLSISTDGGNDWVNYFQTEAFGEESVSIVGYDDGTIWTGLWHFTDRFGDVLPEGEGYRYSTDNGITWTSIDMPVDDPGDSSIVYGINTLRILPTTTRVNFYPRGIAFTPNTVWISTFAGGLRKSTDMGTTWERVVLPPDNLDSIKPTDTLSFTVQPVAGNFGDDNNLNHRVFSVLAVDDTTIYVGTAGGINKSTDGGISWRKFNHNNQDNPISGNFVIDMDYNPYDNSLWATTWKAEGATEYWGVSVSRDGGESWEVHLAYERPHDFGFKYFYDGSTITGYDVFVATENRAFRSSNGGSTWIAAPEIVDDITNVPIATTEFRTIEVKRNTSDYDIWLGSLNGLALLTEEENAFWQGDWKVFLASSTEEETVETFAFPNPFSPRSNPIKIQYTTSGRDADVTIRIFDFGMNLVKTLIQNAPRSGSNSEYFEFWDGRSENGDVVANGVYFYSVEYGSDEPAYGKILVIK